MIIANIAMGQDFHHQMVVKHLNKGAYLEKLADQAPITSNSYLRHTAKTWQRKKNGSCDYHNRKR